MEIDDRTLKMIETYASDDEQRELEDLLSSAVMRRIHSLFAELYARQDRDMTARRKEWDIRTRRSSKKKGKE